jgi:energy-coupling factor transporter ATP-binding protein EcfA2
MRALAKDSSWVRQHENISVLGPTGVGKSFIASALAQKLVVTAIRLSICGPPPCCANWPWREPTAACVTSWHASVASTFWSLTTGPWLRRMKTSAAKSGRSVRIATRLALILTSQLPISRWHEQIGDPTIADGILDRLVHNAHRIEMRGESMRKKRNPPRDEGDEKKE